MASRNNKLFMTRNESEQYNDNDKLGQVLPEYTANALLREAAENARIAGESIEKALLYKVKLPQWYLTLAHHVDYSNLQIWHRYLQEGRLKKGITLGQVEMLLKVKRFISEEILTPPTEEETRNKNFQTVIETGIVRKCHRPQRTKNPNFTPEKGSWDAPEYDGKDPENDFHPKIWVFPTRVVQWPNKTNVLLFSNLENAYRRWHKGIRGLRKSGLTPQEMQEALDKYPDPPINVRSVRYDVSDWLMKWKPCVADEHTYPDRDRRNQIEFYKREELRKLKNAITQTEHGNFRLWNSMKREWLGKKLHNVKVEDLPMAKRIENNIRRKYNNKKNRKEGRAYIPFTALGDNIREDLKAHCEMLISKNPKLEEGWPLVLEVFYDLENREDPDGTLVASGGKGILVNREEEARRAKEALKKLKEETE